MRKSLGVAVLGIALMAQSAQAQGLRDLEAGAHDDTRVSLSVTIPLGARRGSDEAAPRMDLTLDQRASAMDTSVTPLQFDPRAQERRLRLSTLSLTLDQNPAMMVNGTRIASFGPAFRADEDDGDNEDRGGVSPWLIGGAVVLGAFTWAIFETADALSDIGRPD